MAAIRHALLVGAIIVVLSTVAGCGPDMVTRNLQDGSIPEVQIKVRGADGQFGPAPRDVYLAAGESIDIIFYVSDPGGVKTIKLSYSADAEACDGDPFWGPVTPIPTTPEIKTYQPDATGQVPESSFIVNTVYPPTSCINAYYYPGTPNQARIDIRGEAWNWASGGYPSDSYNQVYLTLHWP